MSNTAKPPTTRFWAVEVITTAGKEWLLAQAANQGAARGRGEKLANFLRHSQVIEISETQYNQGKALLGDRPKTKHVQTR